MRGCEHGLQILELCRRLHFQQIGSVSLARVMPSLAHERDVVRHIFNFEIDEFRFFDVSLMYTCRSEEEMSHRTASGKDLVSRQDSGHDHRISEQKAAAGPQNTSPFPQQLIAILEMIHRI